MVGKVDPRPNIAAVGVGVQSEVVVPGSGRRST
jgi:hypothetical protein